MSIEKTVSLITKWNTIKGMKNEESNRLDVNN